MTSNKREKAIKYLTEEIRSLRMAPQINGCGPENWVEQLEIMETCLEAVRAYTPAHIDREAICGSWEGEADGYADGELVYDVWRCGDCGHIEETDDPDLLPRFCPNCGRAMTPEAWAELDKRLRG